VSANISTDGVHKSVRIPRELDAKIREQHISFNGLVNDLLRAYFNGDSTPTSITAYELKLSELEEQAKQHIEGWQQIAQEIEHLKEQLTTLKERKEEANNLEQQVAKDCSYFGGFDENGKVLCKAGLTLSGKVWKRRPARCNEHCEHYQRGDAQ